MKKIIIVVIFFLILGGILGWIFCSPEKNNLQEKDKYKIISFNVVKPNLVIESSGLSRIEVWSIPTGTGIIETQYQKLGEAEFQEWCQKENSCENQLWYFPISKEPFLSSEIFLKGFNEKGDLVIPHFSFSIKGTSAIYASFWLDSQTKFIDLGMGEKKSVDNLLIKFIRVTEDSRCPIGAQCIQAGKAEVLLGLVYGTNTKNILLDSNMRGITFENFLIKIEKVSPDKVVEKNIDLNNYKIRLSISKII